jgi:hypothetical protein
MIAVRIASAKIAARSSAQTLPALGATTGQDFTAANGSRAGTETVVTFAFDIAWLISTLGGHTGPR